MFDLPWHVMAASALVSAAFTFVIMDAWRMYRKDHFDG